jgi:hypothetical protein
MSNGGIIGKKNTPSLLSASGVWNLYGQIRAKRDGNWPSILLLISPSFSGQSDWNGSSPLIFNTSGEYTITPLRDTTVSVKMWGAGGACGYSFDGNITTTANQGPGGGGGYSTATITLRAGFSYIFRIGQGGIRTYTISNGATHLAGGVRKGTPNGGAEGGGYSGIFKTSVTQGNALLIAGGGGGGSDSRYGTGGGAGGGSSGVSVVETTGLNQGGEGGTQSAGGAPAQFNNATAGSALTGGLGQNNEASLGGGGGGYFGGGGGNAGGGGGGSGFVGSDSDVSSGSTTAGSGSTPANSSDSDRSGAGAGGTSGSTSGTAGLIKITLA